VDNLNDFPQNELTKFSTEKGQSKTNIRRQSFTQGSLWKKIEITNHSEVR